MTGISRILLWITCGFVLGAGGLWAQAPRGLVNQSAPELVLKDLTGRRIDLKDYRGKVVLLNFWATWCGPCQVELPKFEAWQKKYGAQGLQVVAVSMDDGDAPVRRTVRRLHLDFPVVMGDAAIGDAYGGVLGLPVTFLINREGKIVARFQGDSDLNKVELQVKGLLLQ